jgi:FkbM family methyltransferase
MKERVLRHLLSNLDIHPVLVDIGASGGPPEIWGIIAQHSVYVGLDPDPREMYKECETRFHKAVIVAEAITNDEESDEVPFYFTKSPYCSSTLAPNAQALSNFLFSDLHQVERTAHVRATSLDRIMDRLSLSSIDWLKIDSQGTDLRIFNSLRPEVRSRVLALDIEASLIDAYIDEDLFVHAHRQLTQDGFWISNLNVGGAVRMRRSTLSEIMSHDQEINYDLVERTVKKSPGWCEVRYLRTIEWLAQGERTRREYVLLWTFALLDNQLGFALDLAMENEKDEPIALMKQSHQAMQFAAHSDAITTGQGWYPFEHYRGQTFRWVANDAELIIREPTGTRQTLSLEVEPGPGVGSRPFMLQVLDEKGHPAATAEVKGRRVIHMRLPIVKGQSAIFRLHVEGGGIPVPNDPRILNFRVFRYGWSDRERMIWWRLACRLGLRGSPFRWGGT